MPHDCVRLSMLLIGFDAMATEGRQSGLGFYTRHLLDALKPLMTGWFRLKVFSESRQPSEDLHTFERLRWSNWTLPGLIRRDRADILHVPAFAPPLIKPCKMIVTVHDIAGMLFPNQIGWPSKLYWGRWLPLSIKGADRIIAISEHTKKDLVTHLRIDEKKIRVIYPSGHESFDCNVPAERISRVREKIGLMGRYYIYVGTLEPRKNLRRILEAFRRIRRSDSDIQLVLVGSKSFGRGRYAAMLEREYGLDDGDAVIAPGFLDHDELNALYCDALGLLFPSLYEGFGIPILEAMASGCPVLTSALTSTPEAAGDAAILVDPYSVDSIHKGMSDLSGGGALRGSLRRKGFEQVKRFSWQNAASETLNVYRSMI